MLPGRIGIGVEVLGLGFRAASLGFRVWGVGLRVWDAACACVLHCDPPCMVLDREATSEQKTQKTRVADHHGGRRGAERRLRELSSLGQECRRICKRMAALWYQIISEFS